MLLGRAQVAPGDVELCPRKSLEVRGSPELQNGGLRALGEAWDDFLIEASCCQVWSVSVFWGASRWKQRGGGWWLEAGGFLLEAAYGCSSLDKDRVWWIGMLYEFSWR